MQDHLRLIVDNTAGSVGQRAPAPPMEVDFGHVGRRIMDSAHLGWRIVTFPFRLISGAARLAVATGRGFLRGIVNVALGLLGLAIVAMVVFGVFRVLLHPFFKG